MEENKYQVIITQEASQMMSTHVLYVALVNIEASEKLANEFVEKANSLSVLPYRCPWFTGEFIPYHKYRYLLFGKRYILLYQIIDNYVIIDYVIDTRQDYGWLLR